MRTEFLCISVLRVALGPRVKLAICKSALTPPHPAVDLLNIDNIYFDQMVDRIRVYPTKLQLNRGNSSDTEAPFLI